MLFRMVSNAYIPSLVAFGDVVPNGTKMVPNLAWLIFSLSSTTFSCNIFWLDEHRKIFISKSADFVIFSDITNKMADASDILYTSTALLSSYQYRFSSEFHGSLLIPLEVLGFDPCWFQLLQVRLRTQLRISKGFAKYPWSRRIYANPTLICLSWPALNYLRLFGLVFHL